MVMYGVMLVMRCLFDGCPRHEQKRDANLLLPWVSWSCRCWCIPWRRQRSTRSCALDSSSSSAAKRPQFQELVSCSEYQKAEHGANIALFCGGGAPNRFCGLQFNFLSLLYGCKFYQACFDAMMQGELHTIWNVPIRNYIVWFLFVYLMKSVNWPCKSRWRRSSWGGWTTARTPPGYSSSSRPWTSRTPAASTAGCYHTTRYQGLLRTPKEDGMALHFQCAQHKSPATVWECMLLHRPLSRSNTWPQNGTPNAFKWVQSSKWQFRMSEFILSFCDWSEKWHEMWPQCGKFTKISSKIGCHLTARTALSAFDIYARSTVPFRSPWRRPAQTPQVRSYWAAPARCASTAAPAPADSDKPRRCPSETQCNVTSLSQSSTFIFFVVFFLLCTVSQFFLFYFFSWGEKRSVWFAPRTCLRCSVAGKLLISKLLFHLQFAPTVFHLSSSQPSWNERNKEGLTQTIFFLIFFVCVCVNFFSVLFSFSRTGTHSGHDVE